MIQRFKNKLLSDSNLNELIKGSSITFIIKIIGMIMSYGVIWLISKNHGAEGVGVYGLSHRIIMSLGIICTLGFNVSVLRYVGEFNTKKNNKGYLKKIFSYFTLLSLPTSFLVGLVLFFISDEIALNVFENPNYIISIKIIAVILPLFTLSLINVEFIRGLKLLKVSEFLRSINNYLVVLLILGLSILNFGVLNSVYALALGIALTFSISFLFIYLHLKNLPFQAQEVLFSMKEFVKTSTPMMITAISSFVLAFAGVFFLELFSSTDVVGIYSVCYMLSQLVNLPLTVVNTISAPKFSELFWSNRKKELKTVIFQSSKLIFWSSVLISIVLIIGSRLILSFFSDEFISGQNVLFILIVGQIINAITGSVGVFLNMTGNQKALRNIILFTAILVVFGYYIFVPNYGMLGAACVSIFGTILLNIISALYAYKKLHYITFYIPFLKTRNE